jgi:hypothetical protein
MRKVDLVESSIVPSGPSRAVAESNHSQNLTYVNFSEDVDGFNFNGIDIDLSDMSWLNILPGNLY